MGFRRSARDGGYQFRALNAWDIPALDAAVSYQPTDANAAKLWLYVGDTRAAKPSLINDLSYC